jgi:hypothetical protein
VLGQEYWARQKRERKGSKSVDRQRRRVDEKETRWWVSVIQTVAHRLVPRKLWYLIDREGDSRTLLKLLVSLGSFFTVRSSWNRRLFTKGKNGQRKYLRGVMAKAPVIGMYQVRVAAGGKREARQATMRLRARPVQLFLQDNWLKTSSTLCVNVVWASEVSLPPAGEKPLDWMLFTNGPIQSRAEALSIVRGYQLRWRIEDFHKTWKSGHCHVEDTQLHSMQAATLLAVMQAAVASRAEALKHLARSTPDMPITTELSLEERNALALLVIEYINPPLAPGGRRQSKLGAPNPTTMNIGEATLWLARLGGYIGKSSGGPPGVTTIQRGLERVIFAAEVIEAFVARQKK